MKWGRAKNILIFLFLLLNIFLFFVQYRFYSGQDTNELVDLALKQSNIKFECELPKNYKEMGTLTFRENQELFGEDFLGKSTKAQQEIEFQGDRILFQGKNNTFEVMEFSSPLNLKSLDANSIKSALKPKVGSYGLPMDEFEFAGLKENNQYLYCQKYKGWMVFDNYILVTVQDNIVRSIEFKYRKIKSITSEQKILPVYEVLLKNYLNKKNIIIKKIELGFKGLRFEGDTVSLEDIPVWKLTLSDGTPVYFKAYDGEEIRDF